MSERALPGKASRRAAVFRWAWRGPNGEELTMTGVYREIVPPERCVRTEAFTMAGGPPLGVLDESSGSPLTTESKDPTAPAGPP